MFRSGSRRLRAAVPGSWVSDHAVALQARLVARAGALLAFYRARLRRGLPREPVLILSFCPLAKRVATRSFAAT